jgi:hypothetical protein
VAAPPILAKTTIFLAALIFAVEPSATDPVSLLTSLGFPGVVIILFITGKLRWDGEVKRLVQEIDKKDEIIRLKDEQISKLQSGIMDQAIPALTRSTQIMEQLVVERKAT